MAVNVLIKSLIKKPKHLGWKDGRIYKHTKKHFGERWLLQVTPDLRYILPTERKSVIFYESQEKTQIISLHSIISFVFILNLERILFTVPIKLWIKLSLTIFFKAVTI